MLPVAWVSLPQQWKLEEVQAGLQVLIAVLSTGGVFAFTQLIWQSSSIPLQKRRDVAVSSLLSIGTIGEVWNVVSVLRTKMFSTRHWKLLAQSAIVVTLTVATIVSGPIAKASTRTAPGFDVVPVSGLLATTNFSSRYEAVMDLSDTIRDLDRAEFPRDQLLDYMPQGNPSWMYRSRDWNSTWSMACNMTEDTPVELTTTGQCGNLSTEIPAINSFFRFNDYEMWYTSWSGLIWDVTNYRDALLFLAGWNYSIDRRTSITTSMMVDIAALHVNGVQRHANVTTRCSFGQGPISSASYTKMSCHLDRRYPIPDEYHRAYPDCGDTFGLPGALISYYIDRMNKESLQNLPITTISPADLIRFYQAYIITKDYQYPHRVVRPLTTAITIVQISSTFIALAIVLALLVLLCLAKYCWFRYRHNNLVRTIPESKLDWTIRWILCGSGPQTPRDHNHCDKHIPLALPETATLSSAQVRSILEDAKCGYSRSRDIPSAAKGTQPPTDAHQAKTASPYLKPIRESSASVRSRSDQSTNSTARSSYDNAEGVEQNVNTTEQYPAYNTQQAEPDRPYEMQNYQHRINSSKRGGYERLG